jgi:hypothetical protein
VFRDGQPGCRKWQSSLERGAETKRIFNNKTARFNLAAGTWADRFGGFEQKIGGRNILIF